MCGGGGGGEGRHVRPVGWVIKLFEFIYANNSL